MSKRFFFILLNCFLLISPCFSNPQELDEGLNNLAREISSSIPSSKVQKIAVVEFSDLNGNITELGKYIAEELITYFYRLGKFEVIERQMLNKIINEHKLTLSGLVDESSAKELGKILGVDYICSGTITDLVKDIKINSRMISTETGRIMSAASVKIIKNDIVKELIRKSAITSDFPRNRPFEDMLHSGSEFIEDFSKYKVGEIPHDWSSSALIKSSPDGYKCITTASRNKIIANKNIIFPFDFSLEYLITGDEDLVKRSFNHDIFLTDSEGRELKIEIHKAGWSNIYISNLPGHHGERKRDNKPWCKVKIIKKRSKFNVYVNDVLSDSGDYPHFNNFINLKLSLSSAFYIANIKIKPI